MRGLDHPQSGMFSYISAERRVPKDHPLRAIRVMVDAALKESSWRFDALYASSGRPSIAPDTMAPQNRVVFPNTQAADPGGYRAAHNCHSRPHSPVEKLEVSD